MNVITPTLVSTGQIGSVKDVFRAINSKFKEPLQRPYPNLGIRLYGVNRVYEAAAAIAYSGSDVSIEVDGVEYVLGAPTDIYDLAAKANDVLDIGWYFVNPDGAITVEGFHDFGDFIQGGVAVFTPEAETDIDILPVQTDINRELALRISNVSASITPAALTKVDDTNVVLTLGGSPSIALLNATSLTLSWTGVLSLARGGTNKNITASAGSVVYSDADSFELSGVGTSGQALVSGGTGAPVWYAPTAGSVLFAGTGGILQQDNANFFWNDSNNRLGIGGTTSPNTTLEIYSNGSASTLPFITNNGVALTLNNTTGRSVITSHYTTAGASNSSVLDFVPDIGLHPLVGMRFVRYNVKGSDDAFFELFSGATGWSIFEGLGGLGSFITTNDVIPITFGANRTETTRLFATGEWGMNISATPLGSLHVKGLSGQSPLYVINNAGTASLEYRNDGTIYRNGNFYSINSTFTNLNTSWGIGSGANITSGGGDTLVGHYAGAGVTSGSSITIVGAYPGSVIVHGTGTSAFGSASLQSTTGSYNTASGASAGRAVTSGSYNLYLGSYADTDDISSSLSNLTGNYNIVMGAISGTSSTAFTGGNAFSSVWAVHGVGTASNQIIFGGGSSSTYFTDLYIGKGVTHATPTAITLHATSGSGTDIAGANLQMAVGQGTGTGVPGDYIVYGAPAGSTGSSLNALFEHFRIKGTTGEIRRANTLYSVQYYGLPINTSWGGNALLSLTSGQNNSGFGENALYSLASGSFNTATGSSAGYSNSSSHASSYYGSTAGYYSTGAGVTFIGGSTGVGQAGVTGITTGNYVTGLGYSAALKYTSGAIANSTYLGAFTVAEASSEVVIGGLTNNNFYFGIGKFGSAADRTAIIMQPSSVPSGSDYYVNETDGNGVNWTFAVSRPTGSGTAGDMIWQYAPSGSTGTTLATLTTGMTFKGTTGQLQIGNTSNAVTVSMLKLQNTGAAIDFYTSNATPELAITANTGDFCLVDTGSAGSVYVKATGTATNTGWVQLSTASGTFLTTDGATTGATSQAQVFTNGIKASSIDDNGDGSIDFVVVSPIVSINGGGMQIAVAGSAASPAITMGLSTPGFYETAGSNLGASVGSVLVGGFDTTGLFAGLAGTLSGTLKFNGATSGTVTVQSAAAAGTWTLTLPTTGGNANEFLQTNGSGVTTWAAAAGAGANTALNNLASVSINASLIPQTTLSLGDSTTAWRYLYLYGSGTFGSHSMQFTGTPTGHRVITFEDATQTVANLTSAQTFSSGLKTFNNQILAIRNPANTFSYTIVAAAIAANRNLTLPLITGTDTLACLGLAQAFSAEINLTKNGSSVFSVGTTSFAYRTTNGGSGSSFQTVFNVDNSASTAGAQAFGFRTVDGFVFSAGNGTRQIARAMIQAINLVNTSGSEVGDLGFYVKASGAAAGLVLTLSSGSLTVADPYNFVFGTSTGTKLGTSTSQKIGIWNATPIVQPTTAIAAATFTANTSAIANDTATFDGYTIGQVVKALRNFGMLA